MKKPSKSPYFSKGSTGKVPEAAGGKPSSFKGMRTGNKYGNRPAIKKCC